MTSLALAQAPAAPGAVGAIEGKVTDGNGQPLAFANVVVVGTPWGAMSNDDGTFSIKNIPQGQYAVRVLMMGYEERTIDAVNVTPGGTVTANFTIAEEAVGTLQEVEIVAKREVIKTKRTDTSHDVTSKDLESLPVNEIAEAVGLKAGVIARGGELHFRGGRAGEINVTVDGVAVKDPLLGGGAALATLAVESTEAILGGLDAEYGNAQSGVINYKTKEGGREFEGELYYLTDDYGQPDNTFDNLDRLFVGVGGPSPIKDLTYYVSAEGTYSDDYPKTTRTRSRRNILNFISVGDRKNNQLRMQTKLAYKPGANYKITGEIIRNQSRSDRYYHMWSRPGYVQQFRDTTQTGEVVVRAGRWAPTQVDSTYVWYNPADHTPTIKNGFTQMKVVWNHTINSNSHYTMKFSRNHFTLDSRVQGKRAWEYNGVRQNDLWFNYTDRVSEDWFVIAGDYPTLAERNTKVYTFRGDYTHRYKNHTFKSGVEASYNDMAYFQVDRPFQTNALGEIGGTRTKYHYYNPEGAFYVQDRWEHEGMVLNIGVRYDIFSVGQQLAISEVRERVKQQMSPRIGIAYPISDRDVFSFHYGRFYQIPERQYLFDNRNALDGRVQGNPNLTNETTVSYQAGIQHLFNETISGQFSVYYKDIFGLLTTEDNASFGTVGTVSQYVNKDYASARGFEATLTRRFANNFAGELNYGFGTATGVASDPNAAVEQNFAYLPISEQPLDWDVRHTFRVSSRFAEPGSWSASLIWAYESGFPYTPYGRDTRQLEPETINSRRLPSTTSLDIQAEKYYTVWGQRFKVFLQSRNVLDAKNITALSPGNWPLPPGRSGTDYQTYFTETGKAGGAYIGEDVDGDGRGDWIPLDDPRVFGDPRNIRMGLSFTF